MFNRLPSAKFAIYRRKVKTSSGNPLPKNLNLRMDNQPQVSLFCPDCRGRFELEGTDIIEDEVLECALCGAEILILQADPIRIKLFSEDDDF